MFACGKALIELTKPHAPGHLLLTYQLSAAVLQVSLVAVERRGTGHSKKDPPNSGPDTPQASDGAQDPRHTAHHTPEEAQLALGLPHPPKTLQASPAN